MKAAILYGKEDIRVESIDALALKPGEVRVQIEAALTCGTDLKVYKRGYHARMIIPPAVFGHELAGIITEVGSGADWQVGDRVVAANSAPCGGCFFCQHGQENLCDDLLFLNGAYAESIVIPERLARKNLVHLQPQTAFRDAALTEPLACVVQGIEETQLQPRERVLIVGSGPIGLLFVALAQHAGCSVTLLGRGQSRLETAKKLGAQQVIAVSATDDLTAAIPSELVFDVVVEAVGKPETWEAATRWVRKGGRVNFFGGCPAGTTVALDTGLVHYSSLKLLASFHHTPKTIRRALELIESRVVRAADFIDGECALSDLPELFRSMTSGNRAVKTFVKVR